MPLLLKALSVSSQFVFAMSKGSLLVIFITILFTLTIGCKNDTSMPVVRTKLQPDSDGVIRDIPEEKKETYYQLMRRRLDSSLGLQPLQNGFEGLQIRILYGTALTYKNRLFLVEHNGKSWRGALYYFRDTFEQKYAGATLIEKIELNQSQYQWHELVTELFELGLDTLPDYTQLPKNYLDADGDAVVVEIAHNTLYKTYSYPTPGYRDVKEAQQIWKIKKLIDKKFGNKLEDPD